MTKYRVAKFGSEIGERYVELTKLSFSPQSAEVKRVAWPWCFQPLRDGVERTTFAAVLLADEEIVGTCLMLGVDMWIAGRTEPGWVLLGVNVHPDHRGRGLMLLKAFYLSMFESGVAIGMANAAHDKVHVRFGAARTQQRITRFKPYRTASLLTRHAPLFVSAAGKADVLLRATQAIGRLRAPRLGRDEIIVPLDRFDEEYEDFWHRARDAYPMIISRDSAYMKWRYLDAPFSLYTILTLRDKSGIQGVVVTRLGLVKNRKVGQIVDLFPVRPDARGFGLLLAAADRHLARTDAEYASVSYVPRTALDLAARRTGFHSPRPGLVVSGKGFGASNVDDVQRLMPDLYFSRGDQDEDY